MALLKKYWLTLIGMAIGLGAGYLYWQQIGCVTGSCPITSSPVNASLYGALMGGLAVNMFKNEKQNI
jgi:hypothetical protein